jgi:hypothetical protein
MLTRTLLAVLLLLSSQIQALEYPVEIIEYIDNVRVVAFVKESDIDKSPKWDPPSEPPLSIANAIDAVQRYIAPSSINNENLIGIELKQIPRHKHYWHYIVKNKMLTAEKPVSHYYVVLMNGKVIPAIKEPESVK